MEGNDADHEGALSSFEFEIIEEHDPSRMKGVKVSEEEDDEMKGKDEDEEDDKDLSYHNDEDSEDDKELERHALIKALLLFKGV